MTPRVKLAITLIKRLIKVINNESIVEMFRVIIGA